MHDDTELLRRYAQLHDEGAFGALVSRYVNLVYSAAQRQTGGDSHAAEDVAQTVFTDLARKAGALAAAVAGGKPLAGWLYTSTRFAASRARRAEQRRQIREHAAHAMNLDQQTDSNRSDTSWADLGPMLDEAMNQLPQTDRDAVLLRFFQSKDLRSVGAALGLSEDAARKRVNRALERLRIVLANRGVTTSIAALSSTLVRQAVQAAPAGLAVKLAQTSLATVATGTTVASAVGIFLLMNSKLKTFVAVAAALLITAGIIHRVRRVDNTTRTAGNPVPATSSATNALPHKPSFNRAGLGSASMSVDVSFAEALAKIRAVLDAPGRVIHYPQPEMKKAILALRARYREAVPILREALHHPDWEVRLRAAGGLAYLSVAASETVPDLIELMRQAPNAATAMQIGRALESIGVGKELPSLVEALAENQQAREIINDQYPTLLQKNIQEMDNETLFAEAIASLTADSRDARLNGLMKIGGLGPGAIDAIPALREFLNQPNREDLKTFAENLLREIDPDFSREREDPGFQQAQAERARAFAEKARGGNATVPELIAALRELPQAIPDAARALGAIGYDAMGRRANESEEKSQEFMDANIMLTQIASGNEPLESRLAAAEAFRQLQPMREKLIYTVEETAPAFGVIKNALTRLSGRTRLEVEAPFGNMIEMARTIWTVKQRPGEVTDYNGSHLESFARELAKVDRQTHNEFVAAMRKVDPKFLQRP